MKITSTFILINLLLIRISTLNAQQDSVCSPYDYYSGGKESFEKYILASIEYPSEAVFKEVDGLLVLSFKINCDDEPYNIIFHSNLGCGIEESVESILKNTKGKWINCNDLPQDYIMKLKLAFSINSVYMPDNDEADFYFNIDAPEQNILTDKELIDRVNSLNEKHKYKQARKYLVKLINRYPFDEKYKKLLYALDQRIE